MKARLLLFLLGYPAGAFAEERSKLRTEFFSKRVAHRP